NTSLRKEIVDAFIEKNKERSIYVDELASLLNLSTAYFKTWFKENVGISPKNYINRKKIAQAKIDLKQIKNVTHVAYNLGFGSSQYFATIFKKYTGMSPSRYIKS
ncbi:MAG: helix-turn-helix transcriptional regulator, partial [Flavobacteriaceae bacterium]|nr:helix-turn-helix transcriptional regulator [Flavobacteriaceae bacterium]